MGSNSTINSSVTSANSCTIGLSCDYSDANTPTKSNCEYFMLWCIARLQPNCIINLAYYLNSHSFFHLSTQYSLKWELPSESGVHRTNFWSKNEVKTTGELSRWLAYRNWSHSHFRYDLRTGFTMHILWISCSLSTWRFSFSTSDHIHSPLPIRRINEFWTHNPKFAKHVSFDVHCKIQT